jgi:hypothetical protein
MTDQERMLVDEQTKTLMELVEWYRKQTEGAFKLLLLANPESRSYVETQRANNRDMDTRAGQLLGKIAQLKRVI